MLKDNKTSERCETHRYSYFKNKRQEEKARKKKKERSEMEWLQSRVEKTR